VTVVASKIFLLRLFLEIFLRRRKNCDLLFISFLEEGSTEGTKVELLKLLSFPFLHEDKVVVVVV